MLIAFGDQHRNSIHDWVLAPAVCAFQMAGAQTQCAQAGGARQLPD
jgi:hypothetical protein